MTTYFAYHKFSYRIVVLFVLLNLCNACTVETFDEERPYAIQISKYRHLFDAQIALDRLEDMGIRPYLLKQKTEDSGEWYLLLAGSFKVLEETMAQKIKYEDTYGLLNIDIVNYNLLGPQLIPFDEGESAKALIGAAQPELPREVYNTMRKFPYSRTFQLQNAQIISTLDSVDVNVMRFASMRGVMPDLPRGIIPDRFIKHTEILAEAVYQDELIGGNFTTHVIKFKEKHPYGSNIAEYFAKTIKDTREYSFEEMLPISINAGKALEGFAVNIEPRKGRIRRYLVLSQPSDSLFLYFVQSAKTKEKQMEAFASYLSYDIGLTGYHHFHNTLYTLPETIDGDNHLIYFQMQKLENPRGRYANLLDGFVKSKTIFFNEEKGVWEYELQKLQDEEKAAFLFDKQYRPSRNKDSVNIRNQPGWLVEVRRRDRDRRNWIDMADELQFHSEGNIITLSNKKRAWLEKQDMLNFAQRLQLKTKQKSSGNGFFW